MHSVGAMKSFTSPSGNDDGEAEYDTTVTQSSMVTVSASFGLLRAIAGRMLTRTAADERFGYGRSKCELRCTALQWLLRSIGRISPRQLFYIYLQTPGKLNPTTAVTTTYHVHQHDKEPAGLLVSCLRSSPRRDQTILLIQDGSINICKMAVEHRMSFPFMNGEIITT
jgi:hypothetical protein